MIIVADLHLDTESSSAILTELMDAALSDNDKTMIIAGDLIKRSRSGEYSDIFDFIRNGISVGIRFVCTPGNHDIGGIFTGKGPIFRNSGWKKYLEFLQSNVFQQDCVLSSRDFDSISMIDDDIFVAARTTHSRPFRSKRIDGDQIKWITEELSNCEEVKSGNHRFHLVMHHSYWRMKDDSHGSIHRRKRLEKQLLLPFGFCTIINGHNHRFSEGYFETQNNRKRIYHIQAPTMSKRNRGNPTGYIQWTPGKEGSAVMVEMN